MSLEQFNLHQQDVRSRTDSLAKAVFVLSGGALSISIGIFSSNKNITDCAASILKFSWWSLTTTIISLVIMLFIVIARDYAFGERWRKLLDNKIESADKSNTVVDTFIWILAIIGLIAFIVGFIGLAFTASSVVGSA
jgi:hypothetical protein